MKKLITISLFMIICLLFLIPTALAEAPQQKEETVYGLGLWDGKTYSSTFCPEEVNKIYMVSDHQSIFSVRKTKVYYWPITKEYKADWFGQNDLLEGTLEILQNDKVVKTIEMQNYVFYYPNGQYSNEINLVVGKEAEETFTGYKDKIDAYMKAMSEYYQKQEEYKDKINELLERVNKTKEKIPEEELPEEPVKPAPPEDYSTKPQKSFILELEQGNYQLQFRDKDGQLIAGTKKELTVFTNRRQGVGYKVLPEDKWTYPENSYERNDIFYMEGERTIYLQPHDAAEYPEKGYVKLSQLHKPETDQLSEDTWRWIPQAPRNKGTLQLLKNGKVIEEIKEEPYQVVQTPGYALGYEIKKWEQQGADRPPTFRGYKLNINVDGKYTVRMLDEDGEVLTKSIREIRPIKGENDNWLFVISIIPLLLGIGVFFWRRRR